MSPTTTTDRPATDTQAAPITVTEKAATEVKRIIAEQQGGGVSEKIYLRLRVVGGGCSGYQHRLDLDTQVGERDQVFDVHGVPVVVDRISLMYLSGAVVDYHDELNRRGFSVSNPNAKSHCGCGSSFSM
jgi:iron-sulfur cluster assembly accessory protein